MDGTLLIVDALNFLFRAFHALPPLTTKTGEPCGALFGLCQMLLRIHREQRPTHVCAVFDSPGPGFREQMYSEYKANRPATPPELLSQIKRADELFKAFGFSCWMKEGMEADDVIASLAKSSAEANLGVLIASSDKDLMQMVDGRVRLLDTMKNRVLGVAEVVDKWGVPPEKLGDLLALMGDSSDNVPGVPGIGPKTAADLLTEWGSIEGILGHVDAIKGKKGQSIRDNRETLLLSRRLVALVDTIPPVEPVGELRWSGPQWPRLVTLFEDLGFNGLTAMAKERAGEVAGGESEAVATAAAPQPQAKQETTQGDFEAMRAAASQASAMGLAYLLDEGGESLVGLSVALPAGETFYFPVGRRALGEASGMEEAAFLDAWAGFAGTHRAPIHVQDSKPFEKYLRAHGQSLTGMGIDLTLANLVLPQPLPFGSLTELVGALGIDASVDRGAWLGQGKGAKDARGVPGSTMAAALVAEARACLDAGEKLHQSLVAADKLSLYRDVELALVPVLAKMERTGILLDGDYLRALSNEVAVHAQALQGQIHALAGVPFNLASPKQLAEILFVKLGLPVIKKTKTGPSTDADVLEELSTLHPLPAQLLEWRTLTKLQGTYLEALPGQVNPRTHRIHTTFHQDVAATGRLSSTDPNLQNIPIRSEVGRKIRNAFRAAPGFAIVSADYSQIELRVLAHFCEDPAFLEAFRTGADIHRRTAAEVFGVPEGEVSSEQRRIAKAINFGLVFGQTDFGLAQVLRIPRKDAKHYIDGYFQRYQKVRQFMDQAIEDARRNRQVSTLLGRVRALPDITSSKAPARNYAERIARNTPIQGSAADILKLAMIAVDRGLVAFPAVKLLLTVHDELVFEVPLGEVEDFKQWVKERMEQAYSLKVPLLVEVGAGASWGEAH